MQPRFRIAWDLLTGWAVIDMVSDQLAEINGLPLIGLLPDEADDLANALNELDPLGKTMNRAGFVEGRFG